MLAYLYICNSYLFLLHVWILYVNKIVMLFCVSKCCWNKDFVFFSTFFRRRKFIYRAPDYEKFSNALGDKIRCLIIGRLLNWLTDPKAQTGARLPYQLIVTDEELE